jgi:hypothetical protein
LKKLAESYSAKPGAKDDDEVPELVENFDEAAKKPEEEKQ